MEDWRVNYLLYAGRSWYGRDRDSESAIRVWITKKCESYEFGLRLILVEVIPNVTN